MDFGYSPSQDSGGTCHLSPSHLRNVDSVSAMRNLRRSISRSPSRSQLLEARSRPSSPKSPQSPTHYFPSPLKNIANATVASSSPFEPLTPSTPDLSLGNGARRTRPALRRTTPLRNLASTRTVSATPIRKALSDSSDNGNSNTPSTKSPTEMNGKENLTPGSSSPVASSPFVLPPMDEELKEKTTHWEELAMTQTMRDWQPAKSSPLKRSDGVMNLDKSQLGSPFAKRRTICISSMTSPFQLPDDSLEQTIGHLSDHDDNNNDDDDMSADEMSSSLRTRHVHSRFAGLRKTTFQHRSLERANVNRSRRSVDFAPLSPSSARHGKTRNRMSLDSHSRRLDVDREPIAFESTWNDSVRTPFSRSVRQNPHPLSKALSPSSPTPPRALNPTVSKVAPKSIFASPAVPQINFSKSLPIGALRPNLKGLISSKYDSSFSSSSETSFATPETYKMARPDPAAFRSTGLISKRHRNPEDLPPPPAGHPGMPDTPCKKLPVDFTFSSSPSPSNNTTTKPRFAQPEFGTPSKLPFSVRQQPDATPAPFKQTTMASAGGGPHNTQSINRQTSFTSNDGDEHLHSPADKTDSQSSADELPPTPTKQASNHPHGKPNSLRSSLFGRRPSIGPGTFIPPTEVSSDAATASEQVAPPAASFTALFPSTRSSPKTPADSFIPDPSCLSISPSGRNAHSPHLHPGFGSGWSRPPATPTSHSRDANNPFQFDPQIHVTPSNHNSHLWGTADVDPSLNARFKRSEWFGRGEFSDVYRVYQPTETAERVSYLDSLLPGSATGATPLPDRVWVVKKSRLPFSGLKLRERKLKEASIMQALGRHDHIVNYIDSWEANSHLYIQMEYCEGGSLESFLARTGNKGRLDDFRIWKILIELSLGVQHIHRSGYLHLDLKPANVFITFEGTLKIGDFGLATEYPAPAHIEGEGDRRYMGPDLLQGSTDKPADIFALGMMMFEIGGNLILPDNGASWQKLRSGDWSGLPSLTSGSTNSIFQSSRDSLNTSSRLLDEVIEHSQGTLLETSTGMDVSMPTVIWKDNESIIEPNFDGNGEEWAHPPKFMLDAHDEQALDRLVHWMMLPNPIDRPTVDQILTSGGVQWVDLRRRAGATVFEGNWGPPNHVLNHISPATTNRSRNELEDAEMLDA